MKLAPCRSFSWKTTTCLPTRSREVLRRKAGTSFARPTHRLRGSRCAGTPYEPPADAGEDPYNRAEGDGTCTNACFDLFSF